MRPDLMWAAGFYEGEGSICAAGHGLSLTVAQVDSEPLLRFAEVFQVGTIRATRGGALRVFRCHGRRAQGVAMALFPHLSRRRQDQILGALMAYASRRVRDPLRCRRGHLYSAVGVYIPPNGGRECAACRSNRRHGVPGGSVELPTAWERRVGLREYIPSSPADEYAPTEQT